MVPVWGQVSLSFVVPDKGQIYRTHAGGFSRGPRGHWVCILPLAQLRVTSVQGLSPDKEKRYSHPPRMARKGLLGFSRAIAK